MVWLVPSPCFGHAVLLVHCLCLVVPLLSGLYLLAAPCFPRWRGRHCWTACGRVIRRQGLWFLRRLRRRIRCPAISAEYGRGRGGCRSNLTTAGAWFRLRAVGRRGGGGGAGGWRCLDCRRRGGTTCGFCLLPALFRAAQAPLRDALGCALCDLIRAAQGLSRRREAASRDAPETD